MLNPETPRSQTLTPAVRDQRGNLAIESPEAPRLANPTANFDDFVLEDDMIVLRSGENPLNDAKMEEIEKMVKNARENK